MANLFPTVLSLMGVSSGLLKPALDLAAPCRGASEFADPVPARQVPTAL